MRGFEESESVSELANSPAEPRFGRLLRCRSIRKLHILGLEKGYDLVTLTLCVVHPAVIPALEKKAFKTNVEKEDCNYDREGSVDVVVKDTLNHVFVEPNHTVKAEPSEKGSKNEQLDELEVKVDSGLAEKAVEVPPVVGSEVEGGEVLLVLVVHGYEIFEHQEVGRKLLL